MDDPLVWSYPPQLGVAGHVAPESAHVRHDFLKRVSYNPWSERLNCRDAQFITSAEGEGQPMTFMISIGLENDIGRGVVRIRIHRVGPVQLSRRVKARIVSP